MKSLFVEIINCSGRGSVIHIVHQEVRRAVNNSLSTDFFYRHNECVMADVFSKLRKSS